MGGLRQREGRAEGRGEGGRGAGGSFIARYGQLAIEAVCVRV